MVYAIRVKPSSARKITNSLTHADRRTFHHGPHRYVLTYWAPSTSFFRFVVVAVVQNGKKERRVMSCALIGRVNVWTWKWCTELGRSGWKWRGNWNVSAFASSHVIGLGGQKKTAVPQRTRETYSEANLQQNVHIVTWCGSETIEQLNEKEHSIINPKRLKHTRHKSL